MAIDENKAVVQRFVREVLQELNADAVDDLVAPDFESHTWGLQGDPRAALKMVMQGMRAALSEIHFRIEDLIADGDKVAARITSSATQTGEFHGMPASGRHYEIGEIHIFRVSDGRIAAHWHQYDQTGLMKQLSGAD